MTLEQWNTVIGVNLTGMFLCAREAVREITPARTAARGFARDRQDHLHLVGPRGDPVGRSRQLRGLEGRSEALHADPGPGAGPRWIRVNSIAPGAIQTPIDRNASETPQALESLLNLIPYGRIGQPEDIGRVAVFPISQPLASLSFSFGIGAAYGALPPAWQIAFAIVVGLAIGSFINVVARRLPSCWSAHGVMKSAKPPASAARKRTACRPLQPMGAA